MEGIDYDNKIEKIKEFFSKNLMYILIFLIVIVIVLLILPNNKTVEEKVISKLEKYLKEKYITLNNVEREFSFKEIGFNLDDNCYEDGLVIATNTKYKVYYICDNNLSKDLKELINSNQMVLNGQNPTYVKYGNEYVEMGVSTNNNIIVKKNGEVNKNVGFNIIKYEGVGDNVHLVSNRVVVVTNKRFITYPTIKLNGETNITLLKGSEYKEAGYSAYDSKDGDITRLVQVEGRVNSEIAGKYILKYKVYNTSGKSNEVVRIVNVVSDKSALEITYDIEPKTQTNGSVMIKLIITGDGYDFALDPNGEITKNNIILYSAKENDDYSFSIKKKDGTVVEENITISNIDTVKPTGSCKNVITTSTSKVTVTANDKSGIKKYVYNFENEKLESELAEKQINKVYRNVSVTVYDNASNYQVINCITVDNSWPVNITPTSAPTTSPKHYYQNLNYSNLNYILYYPDNLNLANKNALVVFLHGSGECGRNINGVFNPNTAFVNNMKSGKFQGAVFLAPQCDCSDGWYGCLPNLKNLIDKVVNDYNIDSKRISITGHSLGGIGTYHAINKYPNFFSAGVIVAGTWGGTNFNNLKDIKMVSFIGDRDSMYNDAKRTVERALEKGVNIKLYVLEKEGHIIQSSVYDKTNTIEWMIAQSR